jgi:hypothetical protein
MRMNPKQLKIFKEIIHKTILKEMSNEEVPELDVPSPKETPTEKLPVNTQPWQPPTGNVFPQNLPPFNDIPNYYNPSTGEAIYINWGPPVTILYQGLDFYGNPYYRTVQEIHPNDADQFYNEGYRWIVTSYNQDGTPQMTTPAREFHDPWRHLFIWDKITNRPRPWDTTNPEWQSGPFDPWDPYEYAPHYKSPDYDPYLQDILAPEQEEQEAP